MGVIDWAFSLDGIRPGLDRPSVLVVPVAVLDTLPFLSADQLADTAHGGAPSVWRRQALVALAARALGMAPAAVRLRADGDGRRFLGGTAIFASVAYRSGFAVAAIARVPIGVDIEAIDEAVAAGGVALEGFDGDAEALRRWHGPAGIWAAKEATLKLGGTGLGRSRYWRFDDSTVVVNDSASVSIDRILYGDTVIAYALL